MITRVIYKTSTTFLAPNASLKNPGALHTETYWDLPRPEMTCPLWLHIYGAKIKPGHHAGFNIESFVSQCNGSLLYMGIIVKSWC